MTAPDVRTAAQTEALGRWPRQDVSVMHDADLSNYLCRHGFEEGAMWGAALVTPTRQQLVSALAAEFHEGDPQSAADAVLALLDASRNRAA
ncbi:hypothetical protein GCM10020360_27890 [Nonlabens tegetincola]